jgi:hypothetical protein
MGYKLLKNYVTPAEQELTVKSYHCTSLASQLIGLKAEGYLTVTNKRVVFHAFGSSYGGDSVLQSEVPIEDVSGISFYKGTYFSILHLLMAFFITWVSSIVVGGLMAIALGALTTSSIQRGSSDLTGIQILLGILGILVSVASFSTDKESIKKPVLSAVAATLFLLLGGGSFLTSGLASLGFIPRESSITSIGWLLALLATVVTLVNIFWYSRRPTMSMAISSKGGATTPIQISGFRNFGIHNAAAIKALTAEPAEHAEALIGELGALILDVQTTGDIGAKRWTKKG